MSTATNLTKVYDGTTNINPNIQFSNVADNTPLVQNTDYTSTGVLDNKNVGKTTTSVTTKLKYTQNARRYYITNETVELSTTITSKPTTVQIPEIEITYGEEAIFNVNSNSGLNLNERASITIKTDDNKNVLNDTINIDGSNQFKINYQDLNSGENSLSVQLENKNYNFTISN